MRIQWQLKSKETHTGGSDFFINKHDPLITKNASKNNKKVISKHDRIYTTVINTTL